ncbi:MAG TPA: tetratricopeptide repeat protein [Alphaproteobacteria bacterium]
MKLRALAIALLLAAFALGPASAAELVKLRAWAHPGFGRIVFDWPSPASYEARIAGEVLTVRFARPLTANLAVITKGLGAYVAEAKLGADGRTVTVKLRAPYKLKTYADKGAVVLDLLDAPAKEAAKPAVSKPAAPQPAAPSGAAVRIRGGAHPGFGRLVFDWPQDVPYRVARQGRSVTIGFDRLARLDLGQVREKPPEPIVALAEEPSPQGGTTLALVVPEAAEIKHFRSGFKIVLDVMKPAAALRPRPAAPKLPPMVPGPPAKAAPERLTPEARPTLERPAQAAASVPAEPVAPPAADPAPPTGDKGGLVSVDVVRGQDVLALRFNWRADGVAAAVFRRRGQTFVLFDRPARIELGALKVSGAPVIAAAEQVPVVGAAALKLAVDPERTVRVRREGTIWIVELLASQPRPEKEIRLAVEPPGRIVLPVSGATKTFRVHDPEVGDLIFAVPLDEPGLGVVRAQRFIEVDVLESAQGIAVHPWSEQVAVQSQPAGIVVTKPGGLRISLGPERERPAGEARRLERLLDFLGWRKGPVEGGNMLANVQEFTRRAAELRGPEQGKARLDLAKYFLAHGFGPEALGVLDEALRVDPALGEDARVRAIRGAARTLALQYTDAAADFRHPVLAQHGEIAPWRAAIAAARGDWKTAQQDFRDLESVIGDYPTWLAARFGVLAVEASLAMRDTGTAQSRLEVLAKSELAPHERDAAKVLQGYFLRHTGDVDAAIKLWREVAARGDRLNQARARFALADALLEKKEITEDEAIDRLDRLRFAWREDVFEFDVLRRLAQLYAARNESRDALGTLKQAATYFRDIEGVQTVARDMEQMFRKLFIEDGADALPPVTALALFEEFRELTPPGEEGDAMVRRLAERLVAVDLLDDAARLLDQQVAFRLKGEAKARVALRLAEIRLMDRKPKEALAALASSAGPGLPAELVQARRLAEARALALDGRADAALAALASDESPAAERIRAGIHWRAKSWGKAAESHAKLIVAKDLPDDERVRSVISRAVALSLAGDDKSLDALRKEHAAAMAKTPWKDAFRAVVGPRSGAPRDFRAAARVASEIDAFEALVKRPRAPTSQAAIN